RELMSCAVALIASQFIAKAWRGGHLSPFGSDNTMHPLSVDSVSGTLLFEGMSTKFSVEMSSNPAAFQITRSNLPEGPPMIRTHAGAKTAITMSPTAADR